MPNRRFFIVSTGAGFIAVAGGWVPAGLDSTWLTFAPNAEQFWAKLPFAARLKKISEAGFTHYEFGRWKTKDTDAIAKTNEEFGMQAVLFNGYPGLPGAGWTEGLLDAAADSSELGPKLGSAKASVFAPGRDDKADRANQVDDLVDALKEAVEKLGESEVVLILEPAKAPRGKPESLIATVEEAADVVKAVGSERVKFAFPMDRAAVLGGAASDQIKRLKELAGYYRLVDFAPPPRDGEAAYARVLRQIHDVGYADPIGLGLAPQGDPSAAIEAIRKLDDAAKVL